MRKSMLLSFLFTICFGFSMYHGCYCGDPSKCLDGGEGEECLANETSQETSLEATGEGTESQDENVADATTEQPTETTQTDMMPVEKVECEKDADCVASPKRKVCDKNTNKCVECLRADQCKEAGKPNCRPDTNMCVQCLDKSDCNRAETCANDVCMATPGPEAGPESGPEAGPESGPEAGPESGPEAGPESGPEAGPEAGPEPGPEAGPEPGPEPTPEPVEKPNASPHTLTSSAPSFCQTSQNAPCPATKTPSDQCDLTKVRFWFAFDALKCRLEWYEDLQTTPSAQNMQYCTQIGSSKWICRFETGCMNGVPKGTNGKWVNNFAIVLKDANNGAVDNAHDSSTPRLDLSGLCWNHPAIYKGVTTDPSSTYNLTAIPTKNFWNVCYGQQSIVSEKSQTVIYAVDLGTLSSLGCKF